MWTELARERIGFAADATDAISSDTPLPQLLLIASTSCTTDDPASDVLHSLAAEIDLFALSFARGLRDEDAQPPEASALRAIARRARVAAELHVRAGQALGIEIDRLRSRIERNA